MTTLEENKARILIVDDTPANVELAIAALESLEVDLLVANSGETALEIIQTNTPTLILLDVMMPGLDGFETCRRLRQSSVGAKIPVIFLTANTDDLVAGFEAGGNDYVVKPFKEDELIARVNHQLERLSLINQLHKVNEHLELKVREKTIQLLESNRRLRSEINERRYMQDRFQYLAERDSISGVFNRAKLENQIDIVIAKVHRSATSAVFMLFDMVNFKLINEVCGYIAGDQLLRKIADFLSRQIEEGIIARVSSDKFGILLEVDKEFAQTKAKQLIKRVKEERFEYDGRSFSLSALIGIIEINRDVSCSEQIFLSVDFLIGKAKEKGLEDEVLIESEDSNSHLSANQQSIASEIIDAIENESLAIYVQCIHPIGDFEKEKSRRRQLKLEFLSRHHLKRGGILSPAVFIPIAERLRLIAEIDKFVIKKTCQFIHENREILPDIASFNINLSVVTIRQPEISKFIKHSIESYDIPASKIEFEITESQSIVDIESTIDFMNNLNKIGCKFALDDFGTGFASYSHLQELPFSTIKIDGVFVKNLLKSNFNKALIESIVKFANAFDVEVVGEFVESPQLAEALVDLGCCWAQGYSFHAPENLSREVIDKQLKMLESA